MLSKCYLNSDTRTLIWWLTCLTLTIMLWWFWKLFWEMRLLFSHVKNDYRNVSNWYVSQNCIAVMTQIILTNFPIPYFFFFWIAHLPHIIQTFITSVSCNRYLFSEISPGNVLHAIQHMKLHNPNLKWEKCNSNWLSVCYVSAGCVYMKVNLFPSKTF